uniref:HEAT repeat domain-containing protein n=1 Tax=Deinococcus pimensis TaxID=309888 RepID=UPI001B7F90DE
ATDEAWEVREAAAWALGRLGDLAALARLEHDPHDEVRASSLRAAGLHEGSPKAS